jgi:hypothetical protein
MSQKTPGAGRLTGPYIDPRYQTDVAFGKHSHWLQPWRAFLETVPAGRLIDGIGVMFNPPAGTDESLLALMLTRYGVRHARLEIGWGNLDPNDAVPPASQTILTERLRILRRNALRPLILLNANQGLPCPATLETRTLAAPARTGDRSLRLTDTAGLVPGHSGISNLTGYWAAEALITRIDGDRVTLSKPLPKPLGDTTATISLATLKYRPFGKPGTAEFARTLDGWRHYVRTIARLAADALGTRGQSDLGFDLEIWNELSFGSQFLTLNAYYAQPLYRSEPHATWNAIVAATAAVARAQPGDFAGVTLCDGFSNTTPWPAASTEPTRVGALSKHPYSGRRQYPKDRPKNQRHRNAAGALDPDSAWYPKYTAIFPEYFATYLQTESVVRDLSPLTTPIYQVRHGRNSRPGVPCAVWFTEIGFAPVEAGITDARAAQNLKAKTAARTACFFLNKGAERVYFYAASAGDNSLGMIPEAFVARARQRGATYPIDDRDAASPALKALARIVATFREDLDPTLRTTRPLTVEGVSDTHGRTIFAGDGTAAHPPLYHRDVLTILPFQVNAHRFVIAYYVMTRDVTVALAPERFTVTLGGVRTNGTKISVRDPIAERTVPVRIVAQDDTKRQVTLELTATDTPYLLVIDEPAP